jgi:hypothetical protein
MMGGFELGLGVLAAAYLVTCVIKVWSAFDRQDLDNEIALHEELRRHERPAAPDSRGALESPLVASNSH